LGEVVSYMLAEEASAASKNHSGPFHRVEVRRKGEVSMPRECL